MRRHPCRGTPGSAIAKARIPPRLCSVDRTREQLAGRSGQARRLAGPTTYRMPSVPDLPDDAAGGRDQAGQCKLDRDA